VRRLVLVTGGARSGKSAYALKRAEALPGPRVFLATAEPVDAELRARIGRHRRDRDPRRWRTVESAYDPAKALRGLRGAKTVLLDCLAMWVNNLQYAAEKKGRALSEDAAARETKRLLAAGAGGEGILIVVTNETGLGLVPEHASARRYRDLLGRCNQAAAAAADEVIFMVSGIPLTIKGGGRGIS
jgi:adenosylcobinamide kinase / adenosylcobinamide-phosphate guanylyltransferase